MKPPKGCIIDGTSFLSCPAGFTGEFVVPAGIKVIASYAFKDCNEMDSITIPASVRAIGDCAFFHCSGLTSVFLPDRVMDIGDSAFCGCSSVSSVRFPEKLESIGEWAFSGCSALTSIHIPESTLSIGDSAFDGCGNLASAIIPKDCHLGLDVLPATCKVFHNISDYRAHLVKIMAAEQAGDGIDVVGMHFPKPEAANCPRRYGETIPL